MTEHRSTQQTPGGPSAATAEPRRLTRSRDDRYIGGVAAGLAEYFNVDPTIVRVAFAVSLAIGGIGVLAYLVLLALVPIEGDPDEPASPVTGRRRTIAIGGTVLVGLLVLIASIAGGGGSRWLFGFGPGVLFGILLWIAVIAGLIWALRRAGALGGPEAAGPGTGRPATRAAGSTPPAPSAPASPTMATGAAAGTGFASSPTQVSPDEVSAGEEETAVLGEPAAAPGAGSTADRERPTEVKGVVGGTESAGGSGSGAPSTFGRVMTWLAIAFTGLVLLSILAVISFGLTALFGAIPAAVLVVGCGAGVVGLALAGRPQFALWTAAAAVAIAIPMAVVSIASLGVEGDWGEINEAPATATEIPADGYKMAGGALKVDLRDFPFKDGKTVELATASGFGATSVIVPDDVCVAGDIEGKVGYIDMRGSDSAGIEPSRSLQAPAADVPVLKLESEFKLGYFGVFDDTGWQGKGNDWPGDLENPNRSDAVDRATAACTGTTGAGGNGKGGGRNGGNGGNGKGSNGKSGGSQVSGGSADG